MDADKSVPSSITGVNQGEIVFIPRILLIPSDYQIEFRRLQFPVKGSSIYSETAAKNYPVDVFSLVKDNIPTRRVGIPQEISSAVCFMLSPGASFISGETLHVDAAGRFYSPLMFQVPDHNNLPPLKGLEDDMKSKL